MKLLLYATKQPHKLFNTDKGFVLSDFELGDAYKDKTLLNGKIVAECDYEVIKNEDLIFNECFNEETQLSLIEMAQYTGENDYYCIHIKNLNVFDKPSELFNYFQYANKELGKAYYSIKNAPQNMMYAYDNKEKYILISIRPEWLVKILNGEKTIEIRKKVLKEML